MVYVIQKCECGNCPADPNRPDNIAFRKRTEQVRANGGMLFGGCICNCSCHKEDKENQ